LKRSYARIRAALQEKRSINSLKIQETDNDGNENIIEITDPAEVQEKVLERNRRHFKQEHKTPLFDSRLVDLINDAADNDLCEDILDGRPVDVSLKDFAEVADFIKAMARPTNIQDDGERIPYTITKEDVKEGFKKWKERTSTSPSGRHLGNYKTWIQDNELLETLTIMIQIPIKFGFAPK
jgi:hypothetical protein